MLKNSKIGYNWVFQIMTGYYNWIFLISIGLVAYACVCVCVFCFVFEARDYSKIIFSESPPVYMGCSRTRSGYSQYKNPEFL